MNLSFAAFPLAAFLHSQSFHFARRRARLCSAMRLRGGGVVLSIRRPAPA